MSLADGMSAINLQMPKRVPRTEYSVLSHWKLVSRVTGIDVRYDSPAQLQNQAVQAFERIWNFDLGWSILTYNEVLDQCRTDMGHAVYAEGGTDFRDHIVCPFQDTEQVLSFDPFRVYGEKDLAVLTAEYDAHYDRNAAGHPDQVNMTGIYITMISGLLEIFGWDMLLLSMGEDSKRFGDMANRYADWILQYFTALAACKSEVVMIHDDIVWTAGAFTNPKWYREYVFPNYEKLFDPLHKAGKKILYTSDGNYTEFIDDIASCGINGFVMEPTTDMAYIAKKYGKTHSFIGNADCRILTLGTKTDIEKEVRRCMDIGKDCPGFFMAVGNHIPANVPVENALWYQEFYEKYGARD